MKLAFVCTGNICRSPMAEYMLKNRLDEPETDQIEILSAGVAASPGRPPSPPAVKALSEIGIDSLQMHSATPVAELDLGSGDLMLTMTPAHLTRIPEKFSEDGVEVAVLKEYVGRKGGISDPFGASVERYREVREELDSILEDLRKDLFHQEFS